MSVDLADYPEPLCLPANCRLRSNNTDCLNTALPKQVKDRSENNVVIAHSNLNYLVKCCR